MTMNKELHHHPTQKHLNVRSSLKPLLHRSTFEKSPIQQLSSVRYHDSPMEVFCENRYLYHHDLENVWPMTKPCASSFLAYMQFLFAQHFQHLNHKNDFR